MFFVFRFSHEKKKKIQINWRNMEESFQCDSSNIFRLLWFIVVWPFVVKRRKKEFHANFNYPKRNQQSLLHKCKSQYITVSSARRKEEVLSMFQTFRREKDPKKVSIDDLNQSINKYSWATKRLPAPWGIHQWSIVSRRTVKGLIWVEFHPRTKATSKKRLTW